MSTYCTLIFKYDYFQWSDLFHFYISAEFNKLYGLHSVLATDKVYISCNIMYFCEIGKVYPMVKILVSSLLCLSPEISPNIHNA